MNNFGEMTMNYEEVSIGDRPTVPFPMPFAQPVSRKEVKEEKDTKYIISFNRQEGWLEVISHHHNEGLDVPYKAMCETRFFTEELLSYWMERTVCGYASVFECKRVLPL
jgi:hypothetical protein